MRLVIGDKRRDVAVVAALTRVRLDSKLMADVENGMNGEGLETLIQVAVDGAIDRLEEELA